LVQGESEQLQAAAYHLDFAQGSAKSVTRSKTPFATISTIALSFAPILPDSGERFVSGQILPNGSTSHWSGHSFPVELRFRDLRVREACAAQAELAREYGISGFCYYRD
jgi:hypothetical protein